MKVCCRRPIGKNMKILYHLANMKIYPMHNIKKRKNFFLKIVLRVHFFIYAQ